jgi:hyaluronan synthase
MKYSAKYRPRVSLLIANFIFLMLALWGVRHVFSVIMFAHGWGTHFTLVFTFAFVVLVWQMLLACLERPYTVTDAEQGQLDKLRTIVNVPVCNEDEPALKACLESIFAQSRRIDLVHVVVNGPNKVDYFDLEAWAQVEAASVGIPLVWDVQAIAGKRQAQAATAREFLEPSDIFVTIDSDAYLDEHAVAEGIKPFAQPRIASVAGVVLAINHREKLLTRLSDLWFVTGQLVDRSSFSFMGSVIVNSGALALYRGHVILNNLNGYTHETFFGRPVEISDDSLITIYALREGRAVQQPTSFAFTLMPETMSHHIRQQLRWMRGAFIRSWWRFKYLPLTSYAFWGHALGWCQLFLSSVVFGTLFVWMPVRYHMIIPWLLFIPLMVGYGQALRYFAVWRSDESFAYRVATFAMEPVAALWSFFVLRFLRYYSIATCLKTGWGTRQDVEVGLDAAKTEPLRPLGVAYDASR